MKHAKKENSPEKQLKLLFKNYRHMTPKLQKALTSLGFSVEKKKHIVISKDNVHFICSSTPSDNRSGKNFVTRLKKAL